jgi:4-hydroxyphenylpyruvate dioxygenase-like putative hemolysin
MIDNKDLKLNKIPLTNLSHIGVAVKDIENTVNFLSSVWHIGGQIINDYKPETKDLMAGEQFRVRIVLIKFGPTFIELLQPMDDKSIWAKFIKEKGEGIHHFAFGVSNYDEMVDIFKAQGHNLLVAAVYQGERWCYFDTTPGGIVIEFREEYALKENKYV